MAILTLNLIEPGFVNGGCLTYPEDTSYELYQTSYSLMLYICFTPVVLLNFIPFIAKNNFLRLAALLVPLLPILWNIQWILYSYFRYGGRSYLYVSITAIIVALIILWNAKNVSKKLKTLALSDQKR